ncbi:hypothetical protein [Spirochaeta isovalerica]|uniref:Uncharacterized protein n=1 Tax=Spirochaeta isovalerica TaxID=150 RepID=A0A841R8S5_9SPIO|nr:hypothetical protein [Spirochaeta isovalerica]MBB6480305.1 hypothetical protein [Spirochaeta isovalerica]
MDSRVTALKGEWSFGDHIGKIRTIPGIRRNQYSMNPGMPCLYAQLFSRSPV